MLLAICVLVSMMSHEAMSAPAPAPTDINTLLLAKVLGLAGLKGNIKELKEKRPIFFLKNFILIGFLQMGLTHYHSKMLFIFPHNYAIVL